MIHHIAIVVIAFVVFMFASPFVNQARPRRLNDEEAWVWMGVGIVFSIAISSLF